MLKGFNQKGRKDMLFKIRFYKIVVIYKMPKTVHNAIVYIIGSMCSNLLLNGETFNGRKAHFHNTRD